MSDPLPSWNDGANKTAITSFVTKVTQEGSPDFVKLVDRIAVFDMVFLESRRATLGGRG
jgi:hypothetical protein